MSLQKETSIYFTSLQEHILLTDQLLPQLWHVLAALITAVCDEGTILRRGAELAAETEARSSRWML